MLFVMFSDNICMFLFSQTTKQLTQQETILFFWDTLITDRLRKRSKLLFDMAPFKSLGQVSCKKFNM